MDPTPLIQFLSMAVAVVMIVLIGFVIYFGVMFICGMAGCTDWSDYEQINHAPAKNQPASGQISAEEVTIPQDSKTVYPRKEK